MGSRKNKKATKNRNGTAAHSKSTQAKDAVSKWPTILAFLVTFVAVAYNFHRQQFNSAVAAKEQNETTAVQQVAASSIKRMFDQAKHAAIAAIEDPSSVQKAQSASQAFFLEGKVRKSSHWMVETLQRQALQAGVTPQKAMATSQFELIHLLLHLEVNVIMVSRLLLKAGYRLALQIESECNCESPVLSTSLRTDPTTLPRGLVVDVVADCVLKDDMFTHLLASNNSSTTSNHHHHQLDSWNGWTLWHLVAHFGSKKLAAAALRHVVDQPSSLAADLTTTDPFGRTPFDIAMQRGFPEDTAQLFLPANSEEEEPKAPPVHKQEALVSKVLQPDPIDDYGGWNVVVVDDDVAAAATANCSIPVERNLTVEKLRYYMAAELPVLARQGYNPSTYPRLRRLLSKETLRDTFGAMPVKVGAVPYQGTQSITMREFIDHLDAGDDDRDDKQLASSAPDYLFESLPVGHPLRNLIEQHYPEWAGPSVPQERQVQLAIGGKRTGAPPHYHKAAVNTLFYGRKKWFFMPPTSTVYTSQSAQEWLSSRHEHRAKREEDGKTILECVQQPGDLIFVPDFWGHATLNLEPSVAVASEFMTPRMVFDMVL